MGVINKWWGHKAKTIVAVFALVFALINCANIPALFPPAYASPDSDLPELQVSSAFFSKPLLGGTTTISVNITNTGLVRGYNLSVEQLFSSESGVPGKVSFISAVLDGEDLPPSKVFSDQDGLWVSFDNFTDLEPTETLTIRVTLRLDSGWAVGNKVVAQSTALINAMPDDTGEIISQSSSAETPVIPIVIVSNSAHQSTGVEQATGTEDRVYNYSITVQNNYLEQTSDVSVLNQLPDGLEYLGVQAVWLNDLSIDPPPETALRDPGTGITDLIWDIGDMEPGSTWRVEYAAALRYDYYGTDNGGNNRPHEDFVLEAGTPIPNKKQFSSNASLEAWFLGELYNDTYNCRVTGAYATIEKAADPGTVGNGSIITYTISYYTSQYYSIDQIEIIDIIPDGQKYVPGSASITPDQIEENLLEGTTTLIWNSLTEPMAASENRTIVFQTEVQETWVNPPFSRENIVSGDRMTNQVCLAASWHDQIDPERPAGETASSASASVTTVMPYIDKHVSLDGISWLDRINLTVGDQVFFRIRFNTNDGINPQRTDIRFGDIAIVDWLPPGIDYVDDSHVLSYVPNESLFISPDSQYNCSPEMVNIRHLDGLKWWLGDVEKGGWWQVIFQAVVTDTTAVAQGVMVNNHAKLAGENSFLYRYSGRDVVSVDYCEPLLRLVKTSNEPPGGNTWLPGEEIHYSIAIENTGASPAWDPVITDILPEGIHDPTLTGNVSLNGIDLSLGTDYTMNYNPDNRTITWILSPSLAPASNLIINYSAEIEDGIGAGSTLTNIATVEWFSQPGGLGRHYPGSNQPSDENTDDHVVQVRGLRIVKSGPVLPVTIGDDLTYVLDITVPAGTKVYWPEIADHFNAHGVDYVPGSALLEYVSGSPLTAVRWAADSSPSQSFGQGRSLTWFLTNGIDNSGNPDDYSFRLTYKVQLTGEDGINWEYWIPSSSDSLRNTASVRWSTVDAEHRSTNRSSSSSTEVAVQQPYLTLVKEVITPGPFRGGIEVQWEIAVPNTGLWPAHNVIVVDKLPQGLNFSDYTIKMDGDELNAAEHSFSETATELTFELHDSMAPGSELTIICTGTIDGNIGSGSTLTNLASVEYSTQSDGSGRHIARTDNPVDPNTDDAVINIEQVEITKAVVGPNPAVIGEDVEYLVTVSVPGRTVAYLPTITDMLNSQGMSYIANSAQLVDGGLAKVSFRNGSAPVITNNGLGQTLAWDLNTINNSNTDDDYVFELRFSLQVTGEDSGGQWLWWPAQTTDSVDNQAGFSWNITPNPTSPRLSRSSQVKTTDIHQPYLILNKTPDKDSNVRGGDIIKYTVSILNTGLSPAHRMILLDSLPLGLVIQEPLTDIRVTLAGTLLTPNSDYTCTYNTAARQLTIDLLSTSLPQGQTLTVQYSTQVTGGIGAGSSLINVASVAYSSRADDPARQIVHTTDPSDANTDSTVVTVALVQIVKTILGPNPCTIGCDVQYALRVTVPAGTLAYMPRLEDTVNGNGQEYVAGSAVLTDLGITFASGSPEPDIATLNPGMRLTWNLDTIDNSGGSENLVFELHFLLRTTGEDNTGNWLWWPPGESDQVSNRGRISWNVGTDPASSRITRYSSTLYTYIHQPHLILTKTHNAAGHLAGGDTVVYTLNISNQGLSAAWVPEIVDTMPYGIEEVSMGSITLGGTDLTPGLYSSTWDYAHRKLTIAVSDNILAGQTMAISYTATLSEIVPAGSIQRNIASVAYKSLNSEAGRQILRTDNPADANTDTAAIQIEEAALSKSHDAADNKITIGQEFTYSIQVAVPPQTVFYNAQVTDTLADGLLIVGTNADFGSVSLTPQLNGSTALTWTIGEFTNSTDYLQPLTLSVTVRVKEQLSEGTGITGFPPGPTVFSNLASLSWEDAQVGGNSFSDLAIAPPVTVIEPSLSIVKEMANLTRPGMQPEAGDILSYTLRIINTGTGLAYEVNVSDPLNDWLIYRQGTISGPGADASNPALHWNIGSVGAGFTVELSYQAEVKPGIAWGEDLSNTASLSRYYNLPQPDIFAREYTATQATVTATARAAGLIVNKTVVGSSQARWGEEVEYRVTVTNVGNAAAYGLSITDEIPYPYLQYLPESSVAVWSGGSSTADPEGNSLLLWDLNARIDPGEEMVVTYRTLVQAGTMYAVYTNTANVQAFDAGLSLVPTSSLVPTDSDPDDEDKASLLVSHPNITVTKLLDDTNGYVPRGNSFCYTIRVENDGNTPIPVVPLADSFNPAYLSFVSESLSQAVSTPGLLTWSDISSGSGLAPGESIDLTVEFCALTVGISPNTINLASVNTVDEYGNPVGDSDSNSSLTITEPGVTVTKTFNGLQPYVPCQDQLSYTIRVENSGNTFLPVVPLEDYFNPNFMVLSAAPYAPAIDNTVGTAIWADISQGSGLEPGEFLEITVEFTAIAPGSSPYTNNIAVVTTFDQYGDQVQDSDTNDVLIITDPRVEVHKQLAPNQGSLKFGDTVTFHVTVTNRGDTELVQIALEDQYDHTVLEFLTGSLSPIQDSGSLSWINILEEHGNLAPGEAINLVLTFRAVASGSTTNYVQIDLAVDEHGHNPPPVNHSASLTIRPLQAGLALTKSASVPNYSPVMPGDIITYRIDYYNIDDLSVSNAKIMDHIEPSSEFVPGSIQLNGVTLPDSCYDHGTRILTADLGSLAPGESGTLFFQVKVNEYDHAIPDIVNVAIIDSDQTEPLESNPALVFPVDPFDFIKEVRNLSGPGLSPGDILEWVITVRNIGHAPTINILVNDPVPDHTTYEAGSITGRGHDDSQPGMLRWDLGSLNVDEEVTLTFRAKVADNLPPGSTVGNQAYLTSNQILGPKPSSSPDGHHTTTIARNMPPTGANLTPFWLGGLAIAGLGLILLAGASRQKR